MAGEGGELIGEAARVRLVQEQEVEDKREDRIEAIARAVGNEAVGEFEEEKQAALFLLAVRHGMKSVRIASLRL